MCINAHGTLNDKYIEHFFAGIEPSSYIAFNAYHSSDACYSDSQTLIFDTVTVNKGMFVGKYYGKLCFLSSEYYIALTESCDSYLLYLRFENTINTLHHF